MDNKTTYQDQENRFIDQKRSNVKSDLIEITHDKMENILLKHLKNISLMKSWLTPLSLFITLLITRLTATFNDFLQIKAPVWDALFLLSMITSTIWLLVILVNIFRCRNKATIDYLMREIKNANAEK
ncbi:MAG: hypothetical protein C0412_18755 [Flavobacterium sp.]|nr:hypothetical protein [Flavobacterium sp.]